MSYEVDYLIDWSIDWEPTRKLLLKQYVSELRRCHAAGITLDKTLSDLQPLRPIHEKTVEERVANLERKT